MYLVLASGYLYVLCIGKNFHKGKKKKNIILFARFLKIIFSDTEAFKHLLRHNARSNAKYKDSTLVSENSAIH